MGGHPSMLSFSGMAEVLGWPIRQPLVAPSDRPRVLSSWADACAGRLVRQRAVPFREIREMSAEAFVKLLAHDLKAKGVVAGANYRFGYKAAGTADTLRALGKKYSLSVSILDLVEAGGNSVNSVDGENSVDGGDGASSHARVVSSTRARELLAVGDVRGVAALLDRPYRVVACLAYNVEAMASACRVLPPRATQASIPFPDAGTAREAEKVLPTMTLTNQAPGHGLYEATLSAVYRGTQPSLHYPTGGGAGSGNGNGDGDGVSVGGQHPKSQRENHQLLATLPLDLDSGIGMPVLVRLGPDGMHVPEDALSAAVAAALPLAVQQQASEQGGADQQHALFVVVDFMALVSLDYQY
ncbi:hypothetical protein FOA52_015791 [Chlamydomonas sp. UWO 241]|nr:hypothetical protein FOA52_015791 [Chlamydomonas sp. UWO 241]